MDHSGPFLFSELFCGTPPSCLKVMGGWVVVVVVAYRILVSAPVPFGLIWVGIRLDWVGTGLGLGLKGLGTNGFGVGD